MSGVLVRRPTMNQTQLAGGHFRQKRFESPYVSTISTCCTLITPHPHNRDHGVPERHTAIMGISVLIIFSKDNTGHSGTLTSGSCLLRTTATGWGGLLYNTVDSIIARAYRTAARTPISGLTFLAIGLDMCHGGALYKDTATGSSYVSLSPCVRRSPSENGPRRGHARSTLASAEQLC
jgi:hypothetical protein